MERRPSQRVVGYKVTLVETFHHDLERAAVGLDLWRRFVRGQVLAELWRDVRPQGVAQGSRS